MVVKKHLFLILTSIFLMLSSFATESFAVSNNDSVKREEVIDALKEVDNFEVVSTSELPENTPMIEFDSVEDFKKMLDNFANEDGLLDNEVNNVELEDQFSLLDQKISTMAAKKKPKTKNGSAEIKWKQHTLNPLNFKYDTKLWIHFTYAYTGSGKKKKFYKVNSIKSGNGGFPMTWVQTSSTKNIYNSKESVSITIRGYFLIGLNIGGQTVGGRLTDSFNKKYHLNKKNTYPQF